MNPNAWRAIKIARVISKSDPILGYDLERAVRAAVINPGAESHDKKFDRAITVLKSLRQELEESLEKLDSDLDAREFSRWFDDAASAEEEELRRLLKDIRTSSRIAGPKDWLKKIFNRGDKPEEAPSDEPSGMTPTYKMDDAAQDEFVEGKREWEDPGHYVEKESKEEHAFLADVESLLQEIEIVKKKPSKPLVEKALHFVKELVSKGEHLLKGGFEKMPDVDLSEKPEKPEKPAAPGKKPALSPESLESTVSHYADMLQSALGDEKKTTKFLRELFDAVSPVLDSGRASLAGSPSFPTGELVRVAHAFPALRRALLPVIASRVAR